MSQIANIKKFDSSTLLTTTNLEARLDQRLDPRSAGTARCDQNELLLP